MTFPRSPMTVTLQAALGADLTAAPGTWTWTDITAWVKQSTEIAVKRGGEDQFNTFQPSGFAATVDNSDGRFTPENPVGPWFGLWGLDTPVRVLANPGSGAVVRATGNVTKLEHRQVSPTLVFTDITVDGPLRRIGQGIHVQSALRQAYTTDAVTPVAYWPCEDDNGAQTLASAYPNASPAGYSVTTPAADSDAVGSLPLPVVGEDGIVTGAVPSYAAATSWTVAWVMKIPAAPASEAPLLTWTTGGSLAWWGLVLVPGTPDTLELRAFDANDVEQLADPGMTFATNLVAAPYAHQLLVRVTATKSGTSINYTVTVYGPSGSSTHSGTVAGETMGNVVNFTYASGGGLTTGGVSLGHIGVAASTAYLSSTAAAAVLGFDGDAAGARWLRLCGMRLGLVGTVVGTSTAAQQTTFGPMAAGDLKTLLQSVIDTDQGLGYEGTDGSLSYRPLFDRYNRAVDLALDYARGHVAVDWHPINDDLFRRNDWTVSRSGGSSARALAPAVDPMSPLYDPSVAVVPDSITINTHDDVSLPFQAQWRVHLSSDSLRLPTLAVSLTARPDLISAWLACDIGSRISVAHPPAWLPPDPLDLFVVGYTETLSAVDWRVEINCAPAGAFDVFILEDAAVGRLESDGSALTGGPYTATATTLSVATPSGPLWTTAAGDRPFDIAVAGERMTVTNVTGSTSPQTFTVTRSVNGVVKTQANGAAVTLWDGGVLAL